MKFDYEVIMYDKLPIKIIMSNTIKNHKDAFIKAHWHDSYELIFLKEGRASITVNGVNYKINQNNFFLIDSNAVHSINYTGDVSMVLQIPFDIFDISSNMKQYAVIDCEKVNSDTKTKKIMDLLDNLYVTYNEKHYGYFFKVYSIIYEFMYLILVEYSVMSESELYINSNKAEKRFLEIIDYITQHFNENLMLKDVANEFDLSEEYLSRFIKKNASDTFKNILTKIRLEFAYRDLMNTNYSLLDIALKNGFPSTTAFNNAFLKKYQCLPSKYRKSQKLE